MGENSVPDPSCFERLCLAPLIALAVHLPLSFPLAVGITHLGTPPNSLVKRPTLFFSFCKGHTPMRTDSKNLELFPWASLFPLHQEKSSPGLPAPTCLVPAFPVLRFSLSGWLHPKGTSPYTPHSWAPPAGGEEHSQAHQAAWVDAGKADECDRTKYNVAETARLWSCAVRCGSC